MAHLVFANPLIGVNVHDFFTWEEKPGWPTDYSPYLCERFGPEMVPEGLRPAKAGLDLNALPGIGRVMYGLCLHQAVKDVLETLEPGVHQFFPVVLKDHDGTEVSRDYHLLNILQCIEAMDMERSNLHWAIEQVSGMPPRREIGPPPLFIHKGPIAGHHLWRGHQVARGLMYFSNDLMASIDEAGRDNLVSFEVEEVE